jgi:hypothetical protein
MFKKIPYNYNFTALADILIIVPKPLIVNVLKKESEIKIPFVICGKRS